MSWWTDLLKDNAVEANNHLAICDLNADIQKAADAGNRRRVCALLEVQKDICDDIRFEQQLDREGE